jgi:hypothetical protein
VTSYGGVSPRVVEVLVLPRCQCKGLVCGDLGSRSVLCMTTVGMVIVTDVSAIVADCARWGAVGWVQPLHPHLTF